MIAECFRPDKTRVASVLNGFKYDPFHKFNGVVILLINVVLSKILSHIKSPTWYWFSLCFPHELLTSIWSTYYILKCNSSCSSQVLKSSYLFLFPINFKECNIALAINFVAWGITPRTFSLPRQPQFFKELYCNCIQVYAKYNTVRHSTVLYKITIFW